MHLFLLNPNLEHFIQREGGYVLQNHWAYDQVTKIIRANKIAVMGHANPIAIFQLSELREVHNTLDVEADPPVFQAKVMGKIPWEIASRDFYPHQWMISQAL